MVAPSSPVELPPAARRACPAVGGERFGDDGFAVRIVGGVTFPHEIADKLRGQIDIQHGIHFADKVGAPCDVEISVGENQAEKVVADFAFADQHHADNACDA